MKNNILHSLLIVSICLFSYGQDKMSKSQRFVSVGAWGMGKNSTKSLQKNGAILVGICDVNKENLKLAEFEFPGVPSYTDYREMFNDMSNEFDFVNISTPDHTHAVIAIDAMNLNKHVYVQKPLARTFDECEQIRDLYNRTGLVGQMGTQLHPYIRMYEELKRNDVWGEIVEIEAFTMKPLGIWTFGYHDFLPKQQFDEYAGEEEWKLWLGNSKDHGYNNMYFRHGWQMWWDYGTGTFGDSAPHILDFAVKTFNLGLPVSITSDTYGFGPVTISYPPKSKITMKFENGMKLTWYDGGTKPKRNENMRNDVWYEHDGLVIRGTKCTTFGCTSARTPVVIEVGNHRWNQDSVKYSRYVEEITSGVKLYNHYGEFIQACKENKPDMCGSNLDYAAHLTQILLLGNISLRYPGVELMFDPKTKRFTNVEDANSFLK